MKKIPIFINNFNLLTWPRAMADSLSRVPENEVVFIDNASTYQPLLDYYATCPYRVIRLRDNCGPWAGWQEGIIQKVMDEGGWFGDRIYAYTDPDMDLSSVPVDVVQFLVSGLLTEDRVKKCGLGLEIRDVDDTPVRNEVVFHQERYWSKRYEKDGRFFEAGIDTTFACYKSIGEHGERTYRLEHLHLRADRPYVARHLPWYVNAGNVTEEYLNYLRIARHWASYGVLLRKTNILPNCRNANDELNPGYVPWPFAQMK
jgi:glycosyltransferase involved in cell wall biosynthesis